MPDRGTPHMQLSREAQIIFNHKRFIIATILYIRGSLTMAQLKKATNLSWGDLDSNIRYLHRHGLVTYRKTITESGPRSIVALTKKGAEAYNELTAYLSQYLAGKRDSKTG